MVELLSFEGSGGRYLGRDHSRVEGASPDSARLPRTPVMGGRGDLALSSLSTGPPGACCWSLPS